MYAFHKCFFFNCHIDLEGGIPGLYRQDIIHLSDIGLNLFNLSLKSCIEMADAVG